MNDVGMKDMFGIKDEKYRNALIYLEVILKADKKPITTQRKHNYQ